MNTNRKHSMTVSLGISIRDALQRLDDTGAGCLFVEEDGDFRGIITDTDLRRAILSGADLSTQATINEFPVVIQEEGPEDLKRAEEILNDSPYDVIPVVKDGKLVTFLTRESFRVAAPVVIMAGGRGKRLAPESEIVPKPLMPIHGKAIIEHLLDQFKAAGAKDIRIVVHHKAAMIQAYLSSHKHFIVEDEPLGTAGILRRLGISEDYFLTNCDIMVKTDLPRLMQFHHDGQYLITLVGATVKNVLSYGSCHLQAGRLQRVEEKPEHEYIANTGLYVINPEVRKYIPARRYDMTDLIDNVLTAGEKVGVYPVSGESWIDIGQWEEYRKVLAEWKKKE